MNTNRPFLMRFSPEHWGTLERFQHFCGTTYRLNPHTQGALSGASNHFRKALLLLEVAKEYIDKLSEDRVQLEQNGYSPARRARELTALIEAVLLDLYASVDCTRKVVTFIYRDHRGIKQSTRKFFQAVHGGKVAETVPEEIRLAFAGATWYQPLRKVRDAVVHSDVGFCHLDRESNRVAYLLPSLPAGDRCFVIEDIFAYMVELVEHVNGFMGRIFNCLNGTLADSEVWEICGTFEGRVFMRWVRPSEAIGFGSGRCDSFRWFEAEENVTCPMAVTCEAYGRRHRNDQEELGTTT